MKDEDNAAPKPGRARKGKAPAKSKGKKSKATLKNSPLGDQQVVDLDDDLDVVENEITTPQRKKAKEPNSRGPGSAGSKRKATTPALPAKPKRTQCTK